MKVYQLLKKIEFGTASRHPTSGGAQWARRGKTIALFLLMILPATMMECKDVTKSLPAKPGLYAVIETDKGDIPVELYADAAPKTVKNFVDLSKKGFYKGIVFHRVIQGFMAQTGDPTGTGSGGPGYQFEDEISADALGLDKMLLKDAPQYGRQAQMMVVQKLNIKSQEELDQNMGRFQAELRQLESRPVKEILTAAGYKYQDKLPSKPAVKGALAMANAGPDTNGSQFFLNQVDTPHLNGLHTVFGQIIGTYDVLDKIIAAGNGNTKIKDITIVDKRK